MKGQGISLVGSPREMDKYLVVVGKAGNIASYSMVNVLGMVVVFEILMIGVDGDRVGGCP